MLTRIMKWASLFVLLGSMAFWPPTKNYALLVQFVICGSAGLVALEAARSGKYLWMTAFAGFAVLFNPLIVVTLSHSVSPWVSTLCFTMFLGSLMCLKTAPRLSIASITYSGPRNQSL